VKRGGIGGSVAKKQRGDGDSRDAVETQGQGYLHGVAVCVSGWSCTVARRSHGAFDDGDAWLTQAQYGSRLSSG
jgi:hypothetical protein